MFVCFLVSLVFFFWSFVFGLSFTYHLAVKNKMKQFLYPHLSGSQRSMLAIIRSLPFKMIRPLFELELVKKKKTKKCWHFFTRLGNLVFFFQTFALSSTICRLGEYVNISVDVVPASHVTAYWRFNKTANWTQAPIECTELGKNDLYVMAENGVSVSSSECFDHITGNHLTGVGRALAY